MFLGFTRLILRFILFAKKAARGYAKDPFVGKGTLNNPHIGDYIGDYYRVLRGDPRNSDYSSHIPYNSYKFLSRDLSWRFKEIIMQLYKSLNRL